MKREKSFVFLSFLFFLTDVDFKEKSCSLDERTIELRVKKKTESQPISYLKKKYEGMKGKQRKSEFKKDSLEMGGKSGSHFSFTFFSSFVLFLQFFFLLKKTNKVLFQDNNKMLFAETFCWWVMKRKFRNK